MLSVKQSAECSEMQAQGRRRLRDDSYLVLERHFSLMQLEMNLMWPHKLPRKAYLQGKP